MAEIPLLIVNPPGRDFYELLSQFDARPCETSGSRMLSRIPESPIMRAALRILSGENNVDFRVSPASRLTFAPVRLDGAGVSLMTPAADRNVGCSILRVECDAATVALTEPRIVWGIRRLGHPDGARRLRARSRPPTHRQRPSVSARFTAGAWRHAGPCRSVSTRWSRKEVRALQSVRRDGARA